MTATLGVLIAVAAVGMALAVGAKGRLGRWVGALLVAASLMLFILLGAVA